MKRLIVLVTGLCFFISCNQSASEQEEYEELKQEVLDGHDEVMAEVPLLNKLIKSIEEKADSTDHTEQAKSAVDKLKEAHDAMFDWMHDFSEDFPDINEKDQTFSSEEYKERIKRLEKQDDELERVREKFDQSISEGNSIVKEN